MSETDRWLLLIHQIPPKPTYFRVKVWRRLQQLGAVAIKSSVYVLPKSERNHEAFQWVMKEIEQAKGDASICGATFIDGIEDAQVESLFNEARNAEYGELAEVARGISKSFSEKKRKVAESELPRLKKRLSEISAIDFFSASGREAASGVISAIEAKLRATESGTVSVGKSSLSAAELRGRTWVTRRGIHVDRIASAWLIRRFIDPDARFKFVDAKTYKRTGRELRFDMFEAEFTHVGDLCTFEVLIERTHLNDPALRQIAEIIHNIDIRDEKYRRDDVAGIEMVINGICMVHKDDAARLSRGQALFGDLYEYFGRKRK